MRGLLALSCILLLSAFAPQAPPNPGPKPLPETAALIKVGRDLARARKYEEAVKAYEGALKKAEELKDLEGQGVCLQNIAIAYYSLGNLTKALEGFIQAKPFFEAAGDKKSTVGMLMDIGVVNDNTGHPEAAIEFYKQALPLTRELGDQDELGKLLLNLAIVHDGLYQWPQSSDYAKQARVAFHLAKDDRWELESMVVIASAFKQAGDQERQEKTYLELIAQCKDPKLAITKATGQVNLGALYSQQGRLIEGLDYLQKALKGYQDENAVRQVGQTLERIGVVYNRMGQQHMASDTLEQAYNIAKKGGDRRNESQVLYRIGETAKIKGDFDTAESKLKEALALDRDMHFREGQSACICALGEIAAAKHQRGKALDYLDQALLIERAMGHGVGEAEALEAIGLVYLDQKRFDLAITTLKQALAIGRRLDNRDTMAAALADLGKVYKQAGKLPEAEASYRESVNMFEAGRADLGAFSDAKSGFLDTNLGAYHELIALLIERKKVAESFDLVQKTKGRVLLDLLAQGNVSIEQDMTPVERQEEHMLRAKSESLNAAIVSEGAKNEVGSKKRSEALKVELKQADTKLGEFKTLLYGRHPELARKRSAATLTLGQVGPFIPKDTALVEYFASGKTPYAFVVTSGKVNAFRLSQLGRSCAAFRAACSDPSKAYAPLSRSLYDRLIGPFAAQIGGKRRLLICPDGVLWDVPFAALSSKQGFLAERFEIDYAFSATAHSATWMHKRERASRGMLVLANPDIGGLARFGGTPLIPGQRPIEPGSRPIEPGSRPIEPGSRDLAQQLTRGGAPDLPGTQTEADAIKREFPASTVLTRDKAQEATFKKVAGDYRNLHIASHAFFNDASPMLSSIVLAKPNDSVEDGFLTAREIFEMRLNADLVVLSACNTARGEQTSGEGVVGLSWALVAAGVPSQVISQWSVDDEATASLMSRFYSNRKAGEQVGAALRHAGLGLRKGDARLGHPYYWAPFVLMGDWR